MLNKDQYNQEEYNDYYQQEIRGAETSTVEEKKSSRKGGILILLVLIILTIAGYFGYKAMNDSSKDETAMLQKEIKQPRQTIQTQEEEKSVNKEVISKPVESIQKEEPLNTSKENKEVTNITDNVEKAIGNEQKMSPEEIAKVVQMVMSQMGASKEEITKDSHKIEKDIPLSKKDTKLMSELSGITTDSIAEEDEDKRLENSLNSINETTKDTTIKSDNKTVNTYNKVKITKNTGDDELSQLSSQISDLISDRTTSDKTNETNEDKSYTQSLKKEVVIRKNEMRIIVVRRGDTLGKIAKRAYGNVMEYRKIYKANPDILNRPDRIYIGQKLRIPK